jgi:hypothetical protein
MIPQLAETGSDNGSALAPAQSQPPQGSGSDHGQRSNPGSALPRTLNSPSAPSYPPHSQSYLQPRPPHHSSRAEGSDSGSDHSAGSSPVVSGQNLFDHRRNQNILVASGPRRYLNNPSSDMSYRYVIDPFPGLPQLVPIQRSATRHRCVCPDCVEYYLAISSRWRFLEY